jgi:hypothetical protein
LDVSNPIYKPHEVRPPAQEGTGTTGTTLWTSSQVLAAYLSSLDNVTSPAPSALDKHPPSSSSIKRRTQGRTTRLHDPCPKCTKAKSKRKLVLELGSGVGYLSLCLVSWGWEVISTDISPVLETVLKPNIDRNLPRVIRCDERFEDLPFIRVIKLDWTKPLPSSLLSPSSKAGLPLSPLEGDVLGYLIGNGDENTGDDGVNDQEGRGGTENESATETYEHGYSPFDMIVTCDTIYHPPLLLPLFHTLASICSSQIKQPVIYIGLERRDSRLVDLGLDVGRKEGFELSRIGKGRVQRGLWAAGWGTGGVGENGLSLVSWGEENDRGRTRDARGGSEGFMVDSDDDDDAEDEEDGWEGVEIWKARWKGKTKVSKAS